MQHNKTAARLLSGLMISTTLLTPALAVTGTVNTGSKNLNLRAEATTSSRILDSLRTKTEVEVLASVANGAWYQVSHSGTVGYVSGDYLKINKDEAAALPSVNGSMYVMVTASSLNVRTGPSTSYAKSGKLYNGEVVKVLAVKNGWYQLENGYISAEYAVKTSAPPKPVAPAPAPAPVKAPEYVQATATVNVRSDAGTNFDKVGKVYGGDVVKVLGVKNGWYQLEKGYISSDYAVAASKPAEKPAKPATPDYVKITASSLNVRSDASTNSSTVGKLSRNDVVKVEGVKNGFYKLDGGYISDDYAVKTSKPSKVDKIQPISQPASKPANNSSSKPAPAKPSSSNASKGQQIANYAKQFKGYSYVYGGSSPSGFDCSGFTSYVYAQFGYKLNRTASGQLSNGKAVSKSQLQPGDLVLFRKAGSSKAATHVGLYIGGGQFIHASTPSTGVIISSINSSYYQGCFVGARRIV